MIESMTIVLFRFLLNVQYIKIKPIGTLLKSIVRICSVQIIQRIMNCRFHHIFILSSPSSLLHGVAFSSPSISTCFNLEKRVDESYSYVITSEIVIVIIQIHPAEEKKRQMSLLISNGGFINLTWLLAFWTINTRQR